MNSNSSKWTPTEHADLWLGMSYMMFGMAALAFLTDVLISLLDGKLLLMRFLRDASFAGYGLLMMHIGKKYKETGKIDKKGWILIVAYGAVSINLFIPFPYSVLLGILLVLIGVAAYKANLKSSVQN